ncbi:Polygalacturonase [Pustulibacterium marinum]|uniref:Polygalacturonase n=2 Tax=Pustulibacterium marinum TaxID=1224947 RepID=A0A1I7EUE9_9FLAO|nr:Polygalacturonase [Pustulibacterium marinum]
MFTSGFAQLSPEAKQAKKEAILAAIQLPEIPVYEVSVINFGAKGDGKKDCKKAFDKAIQHLKKKGGGTLHVPKGTYLINGPIHFISHFNLHLEEGAVLQFGSNPEDYPTVFTSWEGTFVYNHSPLIYGKYLTDISITGTGIIDGEASETWLQWKPKETADKLLSRKMNHEGTPIKDRVFGNGHYLRPQLIQFVNSKNILLEGVQIEDAPFWCVHLLQCESVTLRKLTYDAHNKNNDGIDLEYTRNVLIEDIKFNNGDDNIAIKAGRDHEGRANAATPSENILIRNCSFKGLHSLVIGSEMSAGVQDVFVENCTAHGYLKRGIYFKTNADRGGFIKDIYIDNVSFKDTEDCFYITANYHGEGSGFNSKIKDVFISNIQCTSASGTAIVIQGYPESKVENVQFKNIHIQKATNGISITNTQHIDFKDVIIGEAATVPTAVK